MKKLNVNQMKYFAAFLMVLDSMYLAMPQIFPVWFRLISRPVAPLFAFFMIEGFFHTRSRKKYLGRLWLAAVLMQLGDCFSFILLGAHNQITDNIFLTLAIGFTIMCLLESAKSSEGVGQLLRYLLGLALLAVGGILSVIPFSIGSYWFGLEGGIQILSVIVIFYLFYGSRKKQILVFLIWNLLFIALVGLPLPGAYESLDIWFLDFCFNSDSLPLLFLPFLALYSGEKGKSSPFNRYFFYLFYPAHLWLLHLLATAL